MGDVADDFEVYEELDDFVAKLKNIEELKTLKEFPGKRLVDAAVEAKLSPNTHAALEMIERLWDAHILISSRSDMGFEDGSGIYKWDTDTGKALKLRNRTDTIKSNLVVQGAHRLNRVMCILAKGKKKLYILRNSKPFISRGVFKIANANYYLSYGDQVTTDYGAIRRRRVSADASVANAGYVNLVVPSPPRCVTLAFSSQQDKETWLEALEGCGCKLKQELESKFRTYSLADVLATPSYRAHLRQYLVVNHCSEALAFMDSVERYHRLRARKRPSAARAIYAQFCAEDSPQLVNVDFKTRQAVAARLANDESSRDLFDPCYRLVYTLVQMDVFRRFLRSPAYPAMIRQAHDLELSFKLRPRRGLSFSLLVDLEDDDELLSIARQMMRSGLLKAHKHKAVTYNDSFTASELVEWLQKRGLARTHPAAFAIGQRLYAAHFIVQVHIAHDGTTPLQQPSFAASPSAGAGSTPASPSTAAATATSPTGAAAATASSTTTTTRQHNRRISSSLASFLSFFSEALDLYTFSPGLSAMFAGMAGSSAMASHGEESSIMGPGRESSVVGGGGVSVVRHATTEMKDQGALGSPGATVMPVATAAGAGSPATASAMDDDDDDDNTTELSTKAVAGSMIRSAAPSSIGGGMGYQRSLLSGPLGGGGVDEASTVSYGGGIGGPELSTSVSESVLLEPTEGDIALSLHYPLSVSRLLQRAPEITGHLLLRGVRYQRVFAVLSVSEDVLALYRSNKGAFAASPLAVIRGLSRTTFAVALPIVKRLSSVTRHKHGSIGGGGPSAGSGIFGVPGGSGSSTAVIRSRRPSAAGLALGPSGPVMKTHRSQSVTSGMMAGLLDQVVRAATGVSPAGPSLEEALDEEEQALEAEVNFLVSPGSRQKSLPRVGSAVAVTSTSTTTTTGTVTPLLPISSVLATTAAPATVQEEQAQEQEEEKSKMADASSTSAAAAAATAAPAGVDSTTTLLLLAAEQKEKERLVAANDTTTTMTATSDTADAATSSTPTPAAPATASSELASETSAAAAVAVAPRSPSSSMIAPVPVTFHPRSLDDVKRIIGMPSPAATATFAAATKPNTVESSTPTIIPAPAPLPVLAADSASSSAAHVIATTSTPAMKRRTAVSYLLVHEAAAASNPSGSTASASSGAKSPASAAASPTSSSSSSSQPAAPPSTYVFRLRTNEERNAWVAAFLNAGMSIVRYDAEPASRDPTQLQAVDRGSIIDGSGLPPADTAAAAAGAAGHARRSSEAPTSSSSSSSSSAHTVSASLAGSAAGKRRPEARSRSMIM